MFELYACRSDKKQLLDYIGKHEECRRLDAETLEVIKQLMGASRLRRLQDKAEEEKEEQGMWKAIEDLIEDGKQEGKREGRRAGKPAS